MIFPVNNRTADFLRSMQVRCLETRVQIAPVHSLQIEQQLSKLQREQE